MANEGLVQDFYEVVHGGPLNATSYPSTLLHMAINPEFAMASKGDQGALQHLCSIPLFHYQKAAGI